MNVSKLEYMLFARTPPWGNAVFLREKKCNNEAT